MTPKEIKDVVDARVLDSEILETKARIKEHNNAMDSLQEKRDRSVGYLGALMERKQNQKGSK